MTALPFDYPAQQRIRLRAKIEAAVDRLISILDALDAPHEDLEPVGDDEPSLSAGIPRGYATESQDDWIAGEGDDDREDACEDEGAQDDREPDVDTEMPSPAFLMDQTREGHTTGA